MPDETEESAQGKLPLGVDKTWALAMATTLVVLLIVTGIFWSWTHPREPPVQIEAVPPTVTPEPVEEVHVPNMTSLHMSIDRTVPTPIRDPDGSVKYWIVEIKMLPPECVKAFEKPG